MVASAIAPVPHPAARAMGAEECDATLGRVCFGHLSFLRGEHVDAMPTRFAYVDGWLYFRANGALTDTIRHSRWMVMSVTEQREATAFASVVVRGGCYPAQDTGTAQGDAAALLGIQALRDRPRVGREAEPRVPRTLRVFRMHADEIRGSITMVPCPPGERPYDAAELSRLRAAGTRA